MPRLAFGTLTAVLVLGVGAARSKPSPQVGINENRAAAGTLKDGVLTLRLETGTGEWHPDRDDQPGVVVHAFAEQGKAALVPGPLVRVPEGTTIDAFVHNTLDRTLTMYGLSTRGSEINPESDSVQIAPDATRELHFVAGAPGTYFYMGRTSRPGERGVRAPNPRLGRTGIDDELGGAFIIDRRGAPPRTPERVLVLAFWGNGSGIFRYTINGKSWPNTERLAYTTGDSVRFRVVNVSNLAHPMHLHGFYFDVGSRGDEGRDSTFDPGGSPHRVVTERLAPGHTATMTWIPERAGYWLFHCHDNNHMSATHRSTARRFPPYR